MRSWNPPTDEEIERLVALASRPENRAYFFDRLENPKWVPALAERGFFSEPPGPVPADQPGYVRFPTWPEGRYLARVAGSEPEAVTEVLDGIAPNENPTVTRHLLEAAEALPQDHVLQLAPMITQWVAAPFPEHFADEAAILAVRLLEAGDTARGLAVVERLLEVQRDPRTAEMAATDEATPLPPEPKGRVSDWQYGRIIERVRDAVSQHAGIVGLRVLSNLLDDALRHSSWEDASTAAEASSVWRPAIEQHQQNTDRDDVRNLLVSSVRDVALVIADRSAGDLNAVIGELEARSIVHERIALHVLAMSPFMEDLVSERIDNPELRTNPALRHEFSTLLRRRFTDAANDVQRRLIAWIEEGPDLARFREARELWEGESPTEEDVHRYAQSWRRDWYSFISEYLDKEDAERYEELISSLGPPAHPDFLSWSEGVWVGPESPLSVDELLEWPAGQVIEYLETWVPVDDSGWHFGPSIEGLARNFAEVVKQRAPEYTAAADRISELDPTYVRNFFSGLHDRIREGGQVDWEAVLAVATKAVGHAFEADVEVPDRDRDPGWRWCRRAVASLLRTGLTKDEAQVPFALRERVWDIIERLAHDPNPSPEHEERYGGENMDPLTLSINTNRGTAMHAAVEYALWCRRELESRGETVDRGFELMPEVREVLEQHLDPDVDPSLAVRAVYGRWIPWLLLLDKDWTVAHLDEIFPTDSSRMELRDTAWATYVAWCPPYDSAYHAMQALYEEAIQRVPTGIQAGTFGRESVDARLGQHLVVFYWRDLEDISIVDEFFARAGDELAGDVMQFVGRSLRNTEGEVPDAVRGRMRDLWNHRLEVITDDPVAHREEARAFGVSFSAGKLDDDWALATLEKTIATAGTPKIASLVVKRLAVIATEQPREAARVLAQMLTSAENDWDLIGWRNEAREIVEVASASGDPEAIKQSATIVDCYVKRGRLEFRDLAPAPKQ